MHKIWERKILFTKTYKPKKKKQMQAWKEEMALKIKECDSDGFKIVYIDETMFTRKAIHTEEYCLPSQNIEIQQKALNETTKALLMGISFEDGLEYSQIYEKSVDIPKFLDYLENLKKANKGQRIAVFMDNLSVHTSKISKEKMNDLGMRYIYNVPYSPDFNPIEMCFSVLKNTFKKLRMNNLVT